MRGAVLARSSVVVVVTALAVGVSRPIALGAQRQDAERRPRFEVASIRQNLSNDRRSFSAQPGGRLTLTPHDRCSMPSHGCFARRGTGAVATSKRHSAAPGTWDAGTSRPL